MSCLERSLPNQQHGSGPSAEQPVASDLFFFWICSQKLPQQHLPSFMEGNINTKQIMKSQLLQPVLLWFIKHVSFVTPVLNGLLSCLSHLLINKLFNKVQFWFCFLAALAFCLQSCILPEMYSGVCNFLQPSDRDVGRADEMLVSRSLLIRPRSFDSFGTTWVSLRGVRYSCSAMNTAFKAKTNKKQREIKVKWSIMRFHLFQSEQFFKARGTYTCTYYK